MDKLTLSKKQEELLYLLRLEGLRREIELHEATEAYEKALEIEKAVHQYVVDNNEYYISQLEYDMPEMKNGDRVTDEFDMCLVDEEIFKNDFLPKVKAAYMDLYGIDNPLNFVYSSPMLERKLKAEKAYRMIAVDFLKISGRTTEAEQLEKAVKGYLNPKLEAQLLSIIRNFINGK
jgi:hypothetical protein